MEGGGVDWREEMGGGNRGEKNGGGGEERGR